MMENTENNKLEKEIERLQAELSRAKDENKALRNKPPLTIKQEVTVAPPDYEQLKKDNKKLLRKVNEFEKIIDMGGISNATILIQNFKESSKTSLTKISNEIHKMDYDKGQIVEINSLIDFLQQTIEQLNSLIATSHEGMFLVNQSFHKVDIDIQQITSKLINRNSIFELDEKKLEEYHQLLIRIYDTIDHFLEVNKKKDI